MAYTVPRVEIEQEFVQTPLFSNNPLSAFVFGPNYRPLRYENADDKRYTYLVDYQHGGQATTSWPWLGTHASDKVDLSLNADGSYKYLTLHIEDAFVRYFKGKGLSGGVTDSGGTPFEGVDAYSTDSDHVRPILLTGVLYYGNKLKTDNLYFANGVDPVSGVLYNRSSIFSNRDVQAGDWVKVSGLNYDGEQVFIFTKITAVTADTNGAVTILTTADRVFDSNEGSNPNLIDPTPGGSFVQSIELYLRKTVEIPNSWIVSTSAANIVTSASITVTDPLIVSVGDSSLVALTVSIAASNGHEAEVTGPVAQIDGKLYVTYRVLRTDNAAAIASLNDPALVEATLGEVTPANPLSQGVYDALLNANGTDVYYMAVPTDNLAGYNKVLEQARRTDKVYGMVPLTFDSTVKTAVLAHVTDMSKAEHAKWRKAWFSYEPVTFGVLPGYDQVSAGVYWTVSSVGVDPETNVVNVFATFTPQSGLSSLAALVTNGVRAGDTLRIFDNGVPTGDYVDYVIAEVRSQNELVTEVQLNGNGVAQIFRNYTLDEQVTALGAATTNNRRINAVFPATCKTAGVEKSGYYVAAALAGLRAGSLPHRPLTNVELLGFDDFTETLVTFTPTQLDNLASYGFWIIVQDAAGGVPYVRHQLTTAGYSDVGEDPKFSEDSITTNVDSVSYGLQRALRPYIGKYNVNPATVALVSDAVVRQLHAHMLVASDTAVGPQLLGYTVKEIGKTALYKDRMAATIELELPYPLNKVTVTLVVP